MLHSAPWLVPSSTWEQLRVILGIILYTELKIKFPISLISNGDYKQDLIVIRDGLDILLPKIALSVKLLSTFAEENKELPTLGFTHLQ